MGSWDVCVGRSNVCSLVGLETKVPKPSSLKASHMEKAEVVYRALFFFYLTLIFIFIKHY